MNDSRFIKVQQLVVPGKRQTDLRYPILTLKGKWLKEAGFVEGNQVSIVVEKGKLIIKLSGGANEQEQR